MRLRILGLTVLIAAFCCFSPRIGCADGFVKVSGTHFERDGKPYYFVGANFWYGMNLGMPWPFGSRGRLKRELDRLKALGITNVRILGASEGPDTEPWRVAPSLQPKPGVYNERVLEGLDYLIDQIGRRHMTAVVMLNNFWPWSGGMAQYVRWHGGGPIPYPPPAKNGDWDAYSRYAAQFYSNKAALKQFNGFIKFLLTHRNAYTHRLYKDEPSVMAWELANEPRGINNVEAFNRWIGDTAAFIKSLDKNHLVTTGSEGETPWPDSAGLDFIRNHSSPDIDYATIHIWVANWNWYDPTNPAGTYDPAFEKMKEYFYGHLWMAEKLKKPAVLEEFGIGRDGGSYLPSAPDTIRADYYAKVFDEAYHSADSGSPLAGVDFWAWGGEGRPKKPGGFWRRGNPLIGDPPHERQGWNSVYDKDKDVLQMISINAARFSQLGSPAAAEPSQN